MSSNLTTTQAPDWQRNDTTAPTLGLEVHTPQKALLIQDKRPKGVVLPKGTESGDVVLTPSMTNIGKTFRGVILKRDVYWIRVGNTEKFGDPKDLDGQMLWKSPVKARDITNDRDLTAALTAAQAKDTVWYEHNGKNKRKAELRVDFTVLEIAPDDTTVDPNQRGLIEFSFKGMSYGKAKTLIAALNAEERQGYKLPGIVVSFTTKAEGDNATQVYVPTIAGHVATKPAYEQLKTVAVHLAAATAMAEKTVAADEYATSVPAEDPPF